MLACLVVVGGIVCTASASNSFRGLRSGDVTVDDGHDEGFYSERPRHMESGSFGGAVLRSHPKLALRGAPRLLGQSRHLTVVVNNETTNTGITTSTSLGTAAIKPALDISKLSNTVAADCKVKSSPALDGSAISRFKSFRSEETLGKYIVSSNEKGSLPNFQMYSLMQLSSAVPIVIPLAFIPLILFCCALAFCKCTIRRCRRCCRCCREPPVIKAMGRCKKFWIFLGSLLGIGGMIGLAIVAPLGPIDGGPASASNTECSAGLFADVALNGDSSGFVGFVPAASRLDRIASASADVLIASGDAYSKSVNLQSSLEKLITTLTTMNVVLGRQVSVNGSRCEFCTLCCGVAPSAAVPQLVSALQTSAASQLSTLRPRLDPTGSLGTAVTTLATASSVANDLSVSVEVGPAGQILAGSSFFLAKEFYSGYAEMAHSYGAQPLAAIGLIFLPYGLQWCCCCRRCRIGRKVHPAPQYAAIGMMCSCFAAFVGMALAGMSLLIYGVSGELCMFVEELTVQTGVQRFGAGLGLRSSASQQAYSSCWGITGTVVPSRRLIGGLYGEMGIQAGLDEMSSTYQALSSVSTSVTFASSILSELDALVSAASAAQARGASDFTPSWTQPSSESFLCADSAPCNFADFQTYCKSISMQCQTAGNALLVELQALDGPLATVQANLQAVSGQSPGLEAALDCSVVQSPWKAFGSQVCNGVVASYWNAGLTWFGVGILSFLGSLAQYKLYRHLRDNRSLYFDEHEDERVRGCKRLFSLCCACAVGEPDGEEGFVKYIASPSASSQVSSTRTLSAKSKKGSFDESARKLETNFFGRFEVSVEERVRAFLNDKLFRTFDSVCEQIALQQRLVNFRLAQKELAKRVKDAAPPEPIEPEYGDPMLLFEGRYTDLDKEGIPGADLEGKPLPPKLLGQIRKEHDIAKKAWDKYIASKAKYDGYILWTARKEAIKLGQPIIFPEAIAQMQPISPKTGKPLKVFLYTDAEADQAVFQDEVMKVAPGDTCLKAKRDKAVMKLLKDLPELCFTSMEELLMPKLLAISSGDMNIWEGLTTSKTTKAIAEPKKPKNLVDPAQMFKDGKEGSKYSDWGEDGLPTKDAKGKDISEKVLMTLQKKQELASEAWEAYNSALEKFHAEVADEAAAQKEGPAIDVPETTKEKVCSKAGKLVVSALIEKLILERAEEIVAEVNSGARDPLEISSEIVREEYEELEIITDPVLKAFRRYDEGATNACSCDSFKGLFQALDDDELDTNTHKFYAKLIDTELDWIDQHLEDLGVATDGQVTYEVFKSFLETVALPDENDSPTTLVGALTSLRLATFQTDADVTSIWSPRTWRRVLLGGCSLQSADIPSASDSARPRKTKGEANASSTTPVPRSTSTKSPKQPKKVEDEDVVDNRASLKSKKNEKTDKSKKQPSKSEDDQPAGKRDEGLVETSKEKVETVDNGKKDDEELPAERKETSPKDKPKKDKRDKSETTKKEVKEKKEKKEKK